MSAQSVMGHDRSTDRVATRPVEQRVDIAYRDSGRTLAMAIGERLSLRLPESPARGRRWALEPLPIGMELAEDLYLNGGGVGATVTRLIGLVARRPGSYVLRAVLVDPEESDSIPADTFELRVEVRSHPSR